MNTHKLSRHVSVSQLLHFGRDVSVFNDSAGK